MGKKLFNGVIFIVLITLIGLGIYYRGFYERPEPQISEERQRILNLIELNRATAEREAEQAPEEALQGAALNSPEERRAAWEAIRSAIEEARHARVPAVSESEAASPGQQEQGYAGQGETAANYGSLDESYIRDAMEAMIPLLNECYELAREQAPELEGRLVLNYTIGGEPEVGGVVEEVSIHEESELRHPLLDECVQETIYTTELPAPEEGGRVEVTYPLQFAPEDPEEAGLLEPIEAE